MKTIQTFVISLLALGLLSCTDKLSYTYLMEHPGVLKQKIFDCQSSNEKSKEEIRECQVVLYAASNMVPLVSEQQEDPEKFGQRIINLEVEYVKSREQLKAAQQTLSNLQNKNGSAEELKAGKETLKAAKKSYNDKRDELKILLAVVGMNSPE